MAQVQIIQDTEQFETSLLGKFRKELDQLKREFQPKEPTEYLTRHEVAVLLKVDLSTVHNWTKRGKLIKHGIGNRVLYKRAQVEAALQPLKG